MLKNRSGMCTVVLKLSGQQSLTTSVASPVAAQLLCSLSDERVQGGPSQCTHGTAIRTRRASASKVAWKTLAQGRGRNAFKADINNFLVRNLVIGHIYFLTPKL